MTENLFMISPLEAIRHIEHHAQLNEPISVPLMQALGWRLAEDIVSPCDVPGFAQSAMDGYAFNFESYRQYGKLKLNGEVAAGAKAGITPGADEAVRIFTGAPVPEGMDTVVMQEKADIENGFLLIQDAGISPGRHVRPAGSEIQKGEQALPAGTILSPAAIGFLAGMGLRHVTVTRPPKIALIITGDELQKAGEPLAYGQVYESNSSTLVAALKALHMPEPEVFFAKDDPTLLTDTLNRAMQYGDMVILTGGVSVGDYDFVVKSAAALQIQQVFHKIRQKPGKPIYFGVKDHTLIFGLPGNPASVLTCFYEYVLPALETMSGRPVRLKQSSAIFNGQYEKNRGLTHFLKGITDGTSVHLLTGQESYKMGSFSMANCLIIVPEDTEILLDGQQVEVHAFPLIHE